MSFLFICRGYWGGFYVLAIVNSAVVRAGVRVFFWIRVLSKYAPQGGITGSYGDSVFILWRTSTLSSTVAAPTHIPADAVAGLPFLHTFSTVGSL